ncbi:MAG: glycosyltransferase family 2 protein [Candidatus Berkelbacteria bacterium]|nr:MAG: glycosyltransferase family 2 protein [Candidatus Berkelbacteria bacterium]QQG51927.1 MAG: glycosyltransferase family 2 protein [Candidatus Berkelbacteria bacterium]
MKPFHVRLWEVIPGFMTWSTIILLLLFSFSEPYIVATIVMIYSIYWLIRIFIMTGFLIAGFVRYRREIAIDWQQRLKTEFPLREEELYHLAIVPSYKEDISILRHTLDSIRRSHYSHRKMIVVLAFEERDKELAPQYAPILTREYEHQFAKFMVTHHPTDIPGEVRGKGPNITWAARQIKEWIDDKKIPYEKIITTTLDADNRVDPQYFANVAWAFLSSDDPHHKTFQPLPMFFNNIWQVPLPVKITALSSTFWQMIQALRPHHARNFSAHAQSFKALVETDFWSVTTVVEDGHQYWRSFFRFNGNHRIVPIFVPVYQDAVQGENMYDTFREQYLQRRRWYWGASDIPYVFHMSFRNSNIPFFYKWLQLGRLVEAHYSLATQSFILLIGWLPLLAVSEFRTTVIGYNFPAVYRAVLAAAWIGMIANMTIASSLVPPRPGSRGMYWLMLAREWVFAPIAMPISGILFSALPAIDSQTRMLINKPFTVFNVTKKAAIPSGVLQKSSP